MPKYIHLFETISEYNTERENNYEEPWVSLTEENSKVNYNKTEEEKLLEIPLTFEIQSDGYVNWGIYLPNGGEDWDEVYGIEYSKDNGNTWTYIIPSNKDYPVQIMVQSGDTVMFRGNNDSYYCETWPNITCFVGSTCNFKVKGNIMSLINSTGFTTLTEFPEESTNNFAWLFVNCTGLTDISNLMLPATTLATYCYESMFQGCTSLTTAPELPATTLDEGCYYCMFQGCTSLTTAPELPATTLANACYYCMFNGCTSLTNVPSDYLSVTALTEDCYAGMFLGCTSLTAAPELPATILATYCYESMFQGCTNLTTAPELPATVVTDACYYSMFSGCTSLTTAPELPATTLANQCYDAMFAGCTSLTTAPSVLPATTLVAGCYYCMFNGCSNLTTAPELPATTLVAGCYNNMFNGCTSLTTAPELPATTLVGNCYYRMFYNCTNLNYIKAMFTTTPSSSYTNDWVNGVSSSGTFVKNSTATWNVRGVNGIPTNWTVEYETSGAIGGDEII